MSIKSKIIKLEAKLGGKSDKHYLWVQDLPGESREAAINRYLNERNIKPSEVGYISLWCENGIDSIDFKNYERIEDLIGYHAAQQELRTYIDEIQNQPFVPPSQRSRSQESMRWIEEAERRRKERAEANRGRSGGIRTTNGSVVYLT